MPSVSTSFQNNLISEHFSQIRTIQSRNITSQTTALPVDNYHNIDHTAKKVALAFEKNKQKGWDVGSTPTPEQQKIKTGITEKNTAATIESPMPSFLNETHSNPIFLSFSIAGQNGTERKWDISVLSNPFVEKKQAKTYQTGESIWRSCGIDFNEPTEINGQHYIKFSNTLYRCSPLDQKNVFLTGRNGTILAKLKKYAFSNEWHVNLEDAYTHSHIASRTSPLLQLGRLTFYGRENNCAVFYDQIGNNFIHAKTDKKIHKLRIVSNLNQTLLIQAHNDHSFSVVIKIKAEDILVSLNSKNVTSINHQDLLPLSDRKGRFFLPVQKNIAYESANPIYEINSSDGENCLNTAMFIRTKDSWKPKDTSATELERYANRIPDRIASGLDGGINQKFPELNTLIRKRLNECRQVLHALEDVISNSFQQAMESNSTFKNRVDTFFGELNVEQYNLVWNELDFLFWDLFIKVDSLMNKHSHQEHQSGYFSSLETIHVIASTASAAPFSFNENFYIPANFKKLSNEKAMHYLLLALLNMAPHGQDSSSIEPRINVAAAARYSKKLANCEIKTLQTISTQPLQRNLMISHTEQPTFETAVEKMCSSKSSNIYIQLRDTDTLANLIKKLAHF